MCKSKIKTNAIKDAIEQNNNKIPKLSSRKKAIIFSFILFMFTSLPFMSQQRVSEIVDDRFKISEIAEILMLD